MSGGVEREDRRWPTAVAVGVLTFIAGAGVARIPQVWRAIQRLNGSAVIENMIGTGIPLIITAAVGFLIGRRVEFRAALDLHKAVSDLDDTRETVRAAAALEQGLRRQRLWTQLKLATTDDRLRYSAGWQGQRACLDPIEELVDAVPNVATAIEALVADRVVELRETATRLRDIVAATPELRARLDRLGIVWTGTTYENTDGHDVSLWSPSLEVFANLGDAIEKIQGAAILHSVPIDGGPTTSEQLTWAKDAVDRSVRGIPVAD